MADSADPELDAANRAYTYGNYDEAAGLFQKMVLTRGYSASLCFNLANAEAKGGHPGLALLNYERARYLAPNDSDIDHNLQLERKAAGLEPNSLRWWQALMLSINWTFWFALILTGLVLLLIALIGTACATPLANALKIPAPTLRKIFKLIFFVFIPLTLLFGFVELSCIGFNNRVEGVIIAPKEATLRISPIDGSESVGTVAEGELVTVEESHADYFYIEARDHHFGWVSKKDIEPVIADSFTDSSTTPPNP
jgi:tetratricopeptide (TPR) repeat protein